MLLTSFIYENKMRIERMFTQEQALVHLEKYSKLCIDLFCVDNGSFGNGSRKLNKINKALSNGI